MNLNHFELDKLISNLKLPDVYFIRKYTSDTKIYYRYLLWITNTKCFEFSIKFPLKKFPLKEAYKYYDVSVHHEYYKGKTKVIVNDGRVYNKYINLRNTLLEVVGVYLYCKGITNE